MKEVILAGRTRGGQRGALLFSAMLTLAAVGAGCDGGLPDLEPIEDILASGKDAGTDAQADASTGDDTDDAGMSISIDPDSDACDLNLPFHPPGCRCGIGDEAKCWTGPASKRGKKGCHDGVQECVGVEFGAWTACHDEGFDCIEDEDDGGEGDDGGVEPPGTSQECGCVPGAVITCSEDCAELIICSITGTKVCQPDGTWSPCREWDFDALANSAVCRNIFFGCLPFNSPGVFLGDCSEAFECGEIPPALAIPEADDKAGAGGFSSLP